MRTVVRSYFPSSRPGFDYFPYEVSRVGHVIATPRFVVERDYFPGTEILYVVRGKGVAHTDQTTQTVRTGDLVWLDNTRPHGHRPDAHDPWELYWLRFDCAFVERLNTHLATSQHPTFVLSEPRRVATLFESLFHELDHPTTATPAVVNRYVSELIEVLFHARRDQLVRETDDAVHSERFVRLRAQVNRSYHEPWDAERMAGEMAVSPAHMYRLFKAMVGMTPHQWLRNTRMEQAKRRLLETDELIGEIAGKVGYRDQFHFSRDFRAVTGTSPREFRRTMVDGQ